MEGLFEGHHEMCRHKLKARIETHDDVWRWRLGQVLAYGIVAFEEAVEGELGFY